MRMSDWSSDVCSSDLSLSKEGPQVEPKALARRAQQLAARQSRSRLQIFPRSSRIVDDVAIPVDDHMRWRKAFQHMRLHRLPQGGAADGASSLRAEEHKSELQSLFRISYAVFCRNKKKKINR